MLCHPYEALSVRNLRVATIGTASAWGLLTLVLVWAVPSGHLSQLGALVEATEPAAAKTILESWDPSVVASLSFMLGFDFLYDVVHNNAVALFAVWGAVRRDTGSARLVASITAWVLWLDTGLNVFENLGFLHILRSRSANSAESRRSDILVPVCDTAARRRCWRRSARFRLAHRSANQVGERAGMTRGLRCAQVWAGAPTRSGGNL